MILLAFVLVVGILIGLSIDLLMLRAGAYLAKSYDQWQLDVTYSDGYRAGREQRKFEDMKKDRWTEKVS